MSAKQKYESIEDLDWGEEYLDFAEMVAPWPETEMVKWLDERCATRNEKIMTCFANASIGTWNRGWTDSFIGERAVSILDSDIHNLQDEEYQEKFVQHLGDEMKRLDSEVKSNQWIVDHRYRFVSTLGDAYDMAEGMMKMMKTWGEFLEPLTPVEYFDQKIEEEDDPLHVIFEEMFHGDIYSFRRLPIFDFLERVGRGQVYDDFYPKEPHFAYLASEKPWPGFCIVTSGRAHEDPKEVMGMGKQEVADYMGIHQDGFEHITEILFDAVQERLGWDKRTAMWDIESSICEYTKDQMDEDPYTDVENFWNPPSMNMTFDEF